jgi:hypothetical protein
MKQTVSERALTLVEKKLSDLKGRLTPQDAATATGITVDEAKDALARLMELYVTRVSYDDNGSLLFAFETPLRRRGTKTAAEKWAETKDALWRGFKVFFKIWIGLMVIVYFAVMIVLLLALMIAQSAGSDDRDRRSGRGGNAIGGLLHVLAEGLRFAFWTRAMSPGYSYGIDDYGYRYRQVPTPRDTKGKEKSFIIAIYDLALGPERAPDDPLENEKEVAAYLREEKGVLTPAEIVALSGGTIVDAEERMADYLVRFNGEPIITDEGVVVGEFESFLLGREAKADGKIVPYWDEYEPPYEHSGNSTTRNAIIIGMVLFTMVVGIAMLGGGLATLAFNYRVPFLASGVASFLIGWLPVLFSITYLVVTAARLPIVKKQEAERLERNRKKRVMRAIFRQGMWRATADQIYFAMLSMGDKDLSKEEVDAVLRKLVVDLGGDLELGDNGEAIYSFDRLQRENEAAEKVRRKELRG